MAIHYFKPAILWVFRLCLLVVFMALVSCGGSNTPPGNGNSDGDPPADLSATEVVEVPPTAPPTAAPPAPTPTETDNAETYLNTGIKLLDDEKFEEAVVEFDQAIALDPDLAMAYSKRGFAYGVLGRDKEALADFEKALDLAPDAPHIDEIYVNLALSNFKTGNNEKALEFWTKAIEAGRDGAPIYLDRARSYFNLNQYQEAIADCSQAIELGLEAELAEAYNLRGKSNAYLKNFEDAIPDLSQAIELDPNLAEAYFNRAVCRTKLAQNDKISEIIADMAMVLEISEDPDMRRQAKTALENAYKNLTDPVLRQQAATALGLEAETPSQPAATSLDNYETYVHTVNCLPYNKELNLQTFSVLYPKGSVISTCEQLPDNYVVFELNPDQSKQDSDLALVFGHFSLDATSQLEAAYLKQGEKMLDVFGPQIAAQLNAELVSDIALVFNDVPFYRRDYIGELSGVTRLVRLVTIPNLKQGQGLFLMAIKKVQSDPQREFPEFDAVTQQVIGSVNFTPQTDVAVASTEASNSPEDVLQAVFDAARTGDFSQLAGLCDPLGKNDDDTDLICAITSQHPQKDSFVEFFSKGKINGQAVIKNDQAGVPFLFGPESDKKETMELILRDGQWYLSEF